MKMNPFDLMVSVLEITDCATVQNRPLEKTLGNFPVRHVDHRRKLRSQNYYIVFTGKVYIAFFNSSGHVR